MTFFSLKVIVIYLQESEVRKIKGEREMKLHIENIAKIEKSDIEINGITVIAGENSTGKSTVGKVLYCIYETFYNLKERIVNEKKRSIINLLERNLRKNVSGEENIHINWVTDMREITNKVMQVSSVEDCNSVIKEFLEEKNYILDDYDLIVERIKRINTMSDRQINGALMNRCMNLEFNNQFLPLSIDKFENNNSIIDLTIKNEHISMIYDYINKTFDIDTFIPIIYKVIYLDNPYLLDVLDNHRLYRRRRAFNVMDHENKMQKIITEENLNMQMSIFDEIFDKEKFDLFEKKICGLLKGNFVDIDGGIRFQENGVNEPIRVTNLSMGSKTLAVILKLIENGSIVENGILILDEPEIHLHPKWQLYFAEILVMMQKEFKLHILINTHSPYFINAIEVYSVQYEIANKCKYYLSDINKNNKAFFDDVTTNTEKIYKKLAEPLRKLNDMMYD